MVQSIIQVSNKTPTHRHHVCAHSCARTHTHTPATHARPSIKHYKPKETHMLLILEMYKYPTSIQRERVGGGARARLQPRSWDLQY